MINLISALFSVKSSRQKEAKTAKLRVESLEERALLSVTAAEYLDIRSVYADLSLPYNPEIIEIEADKLSEENLKAAINDAPEYAVIVARTTPQHNSIDITSELVIPKGLSIVSYGTDKLTLDAHQRCRVVHVTVWGKNVNLGGLTITGGYVTGEWRGGSYTATGGGIYGNGLVNIDQCALTGNIASAELPSLEAMISDSNFVYYSTAALGGGGYDLNRVTNSIIANNSVIAKENDISVRGDSCCYALGGGIYNPRIEFDLNHIPKLPYLYRLSSITNSLICDNTANSTCLACMIDESAYFPFTCSNVYGFSRANSGLYGMGSVVNCTIANNQSISTLNGFGKFSKNDTSNKYIRSCYDAKSSIIEVIYIFNCSILNNEIVMYKDARVKSVVPSSYDTFASERDFSCYAVVANTVYNSIITNNSKNVSQFIKWTSDNYFSNYSNIGDMYNTLMPLDEDFDSAGPSQDAEDAKNNFVYINQGKEWFMYYTGLVPIVYRPPVFDAPDEDGYYPLCKDSYALDKGDPDLITDANLRETLLALDENGILNLGAYKIKRTDCPPELSEPEVKCGNEVVRKKWLNDPEKEHDCAVLEPISITVTAKKPSSGAIFDKYVLNKLTIYGTRVKEDENGEKQTHDLETITVDLLNGRNRYFNNNVVTVEEDKSNGKWTITYNGWIPKKDEDGEYTITCELGYKYFGTAQKPAKSEEAVFNVWQPTLKVEKVKLAAADEQDRKNYAATDCALVGREAQFTVTVKESTGVWKLSEYVPVSVKFTIRIEEDADDAGEIRWSENTVELSYPIDVDGFDPDKDDSKLGTITVQGWTPETFGKCQIDCSVEYKLQEVAGTSVASGKEPDAVFKSYESRNNPGEIDVTQYYLYVGKQKTQTSNGYVTVSPDIDRNKKNFTAITKTGEATIFELDRKTYKTLLAVESNKKNEDGEYYGWSASSEEHSHEAKYEILKGLFDVLGDEEDLLKSGEDGKLPDFYGVYFTDYHFTVVASRGDLAKVNKQKVPSKYVKDALYLPDASNLNYEYSYSGSGEFYDGSAYKKITRAAGAPEDDDATLERLVRSVPEYKSNSREVWNVGDLVVFSSMSGKSQNADYVVSGLGNIYIAPYIVTYRADFGSHEGEGFGIAGSGYQAVGVSNISTNFGSNSIYMARGTEDVINDKLYADAAYDGVGVTQYQRDAANVRKWANNQEKNVVAVGHSLGGALAQLYSINNRSNLAKVVTFQSAGLSKENAAKFHSDVPVRHYVANGDGVSISGETFLRGDVTIYSFGNYQTYNDNGEYNRQDQIYKHNTWLLNDNLFKSNLYYYASKSHLVIDSSYFDIVPRPQTVDFDVYDGYYFHYTLPTVLGQQQFDSDQVFYRDLGEQVRKWGGAATRLFLPSVGRQISSGVDKVKSIVNSGDDDKASSNGWSIKFDSNLTLANETLEKIHFPTRSSSREKTVYKNDEPAVKGAAVSYTDVDWSVEYKSKASVKTPFGWKFTGSMIFSNKTFLVGGVDLSNTRTDSKARKLGSGDYYLAANSTLALSEESVAELNKRKVGEALPNCDYVLTPTQEGAATILFGTGAEKPLASLDVESISTSLVKFKGATLSRNGAEIPITVGGGSLQSVGGKNAKKMESTDAKITIQLRDARTGATEQAFLSNVQLIFDSSSSSGAVTIRGTISNGTYAQRTVQISYGKSAAPKFTINAVGKDLVYEVENGAFSGEFDTILSAKSKAESVDVSNAVVAQAASTVVGALKASTSGSTVNANFRVDSTSSNPTVAIYMTQNPGKCDGALLGVVSLKDATRNSDGSYSYSFDLSDSDFEDGTYSLYAREFYSEFDDECVFSNSFKFVDATALGVSKSEINFGSVNQGQVASQNVVVVNNGEEPLEFYVDAPSYLEHDFLILSDVPFNDDFDRTITLAPGASLTLEIYFSPTESEEQPGTILFRSAKTGKTLKTIELSGTGTERLDADVNVSVDASELLSQTFKLGETLGFSCKVENVGVNAADVVYAAVYLSSDRDDITSGTRIAVVETDSWLFEGENVEFNLSWLAPTDFAEGEYWIGWVAETSNASDASILSGVSSSQVVLEAPTPLATPKPTFEAKLNSITVKWDAVPNADSYRLKYSSTDGEYQTVDVDSSCVSYTISGLNQGTIYAVKLAAIGDEFNYATSLYSPTAFIQTLTPVKFDAPANPRETAKTESSITVAWDPVENAFGYEILCKKSTDSSYSTQTLPPGETSWSISDLDNSATCSWSVRALGNDDPYFQSDYTEERSATPRQKLSTPGNVEYVPKRTTIIATWDAVPNASGYKITYKSAGGSFVSVIVDDGAATSYKITRLIKNANYSVKIAALGDGFNYSNSDYTPLTDVATTNDDPEMPSTVVTIAEDDVDPDDGLISLREAIAYANDGDTISFASALKGKTIYLDPDLGELVVSKSITISAASLRDAKSKTPGLTIDGRGKSRIINVKKGVFSASWIVFTNGFNENYGGAVFASYGNEVYMTNCIISDSRAGCGGGVFSSGSMTLTNCTVTNNTAENGPGGGTYVYGVTTLSNCTITNNTADSSGGGICGDGRGTTKLSNCTITNNTTNRFGGGICGYNDTTLSNTVISNNSSKYKGGGIWGYAEMKLSSCIIADNKADWFGGGICFEGYFHSETAELSNCIVAHNSSAYGGGIYFEKSQASFFNCTVVENSSSSWYDEVIGVKSTCLNIRNSIILGRYGVKVYDSDDEENKSSVNGYNTLSKDTNWTSGSGNLTYDASLPLFNDAANGDFTLAKNSQAINKGNNKYVDSDYDLAGNARIDGGTVDLGAYEYRSTNLKALAEPKKLRIVSQSETTLSVAWNKVKNASGYRIILETLEGDEIIREVDAKTANYAFTDLASGAPCLVKVAALGDGTNYSNSEYAALDVPLATRGALQFVCRSVSAEPGATLEEAASSARTWIDEWSNFYIDVWANADGQEIASVSAALGYESSYFKVSDVKAAPGYAVSYTNEGDVVTVEATGEGVEDENGWTVVARIQFAPVGGEGVPSPANGILTPLNAGFVAPDAGQSVNGTVVETATAPTSLTLYPCVFDVDENGSLNMNDLAFFVSYLGANVSDISNAKHRALDYDLNGTINMNDLAYVVSLLGQSATSGLDSVYPSAPSTGFASLSTIDDAMAYFVEEESEVDYALLDFGAALAIDEAFEEFEIDF